LVASSALACDAHRVHGPAAGERGGAATDAAPPMIRIGRYSSASWERLPIPAASCAPSGRCRTLREGFGDLNFTELCTIHQDPRIPGTVNGVSDTRPAELFGEQVSCWRQLLESSCTILCHHTLHGEDLEALTRRYQAYVARVR